MNQRYMDKFGEVVKILKRGWFVEKRTAVRSRDGEKNYDSKFFWISRDSLTQNDGLDPIQTDTVLRYLCGVNFATFKMRGVPHPSYS